MKKSLSLFFILAIATLLIACEPPSLGDTAVIEPAISLSSSTLNLNVGEAKPLGITVQGFAATQLRYVSEDPTIASVNAAGVVTGLKPGATIVTASYEDLSKTVVIFVLPDLTAVSTEEAATVVDVQINDDGEVVLVYSDGRLENTGVMASVTGQPVTIQSARVNATGNLIITMSDGSVFNAGNVIGPAGQPGASGGGAGTPGTAGISITGAFINDNGELVFTRSGGASDLNVGTVSDLSQSSSVDVLNELGINQTQWNTLVALANAGATPEGLQALLGLSSAQLQALVDSDGLLSFNRYKRYYPGYVGNEKNWIDELIRGTLIINVEIDLTSTINDIYFAPGSTISGVYGKDYIFPFAPVTAANVDALALSGMLYLEPYPLGNLGTIYKNLVNYGQGPIFNTLVSEGLALKNSGFISTFKGALINPSPAYPFATPIYVNEPVNEYFGQIKFASLSHVPSSNIKVDASGIYVIGSGAQVFTNYEPIKATSLTQISPLNLSDYSNVNSYSNFFNHLVTLVNSGFIDLSTYVVANRLYNSGVEDQLFLTDINKVPIDLQIGIYNYIRDYYTPLVGDYASIITSDLSGSTFDGVLLSGVTGFTTFTDDQISHGAVVLPSTEGYYVYDQNFDRGAYGFDNNGLLIQLENGDFMPERYIFNPFLLNDGGKPFTVNYQNSLSYPITGNLAGNDLRKWDLFYVVLSSSGVFKDSGVLTSSGFHLGQGIASTPGNPGYIQVTAPFNYSLFVSGSGFVGTSAAIIAGTSGLEFFGTTYTQQTAATIAKNRSNTSDITDLSDITLEFGDIIFIRSEVNYVGATPIINRYSLVFDNTLPVVSGVVLASNNQISPYVAKAGDFINVIMAANEPVKVTTSITYNPSITNTSTTVANYIFKSSGILLTSGHTLGRADQTPPDPSGSSITGNLATIIYDQVKVFISPQDITEGYFNFAGLALQDRAGNSVTIGSTDFPNQVWIDPVAPIVASSGFEVTAGSGAFRSSGVLLYDDEDVSLYEISGVVQYNFELFERFNDITKGEMKYKLTLKAQLDGSGLLTIGSGTILTTDFITVSGLDSSVNLFSGLLETNSYYNGLYLLEVEMVDFVGNESSEYLFIYINNALEIVDMRVKLLDGSGLHEITLEFSTFYTTSGSTPLNGADLRVKFNIDGGTFTDVTDPNKFANFQFNEANKTLVFTVAEPRVTNLVSIDLTIESSGVAKFKEVILAGPLGDGSTAEQISIDIADVVGYNPPN